MINDLFEIPAVRLVQAKVLCSCFASMFLECPVFHFILSKERSGSTEREDLSCSAVGSDERRMPMEKRRKCGKKTGQSKYAKAISQRQGVHTNVQPGRFLSWQRKNNRTASTPEVDSNTEPVGKVFLLISADRKKKNDLKLSEN